MHRLLSKLRDSSRSSTVSRKPNLNLSSLFPRLDDLTDPPLPPDVLSIQVLGQAASAANFLYGGYVVAQGLKSSLELIGKPLHRFQRVLDFGCGCARVLRWFRDYSVCCEFHGCDISAEAVSWNQSAMPFGQYRATLPSPPLPYPNHYFDYVYGVSVLTHLDEDLQFAWLAELKRILQPGGILMLSVMGEEVLASRANPTEQETFRNTGFLYKRIQAGLHGLPDFYQDAYHSQSYIERVWTPFFHLRAVIRNGPLYMQNLVILQKPGRGIPPANGHLSLDLPLGGFDHPAIASDVTSPKLPVRGWSFRFDGIAFDADILIDGRRAGAVTPSDRSEGVAEALPFWPAAANAGFSVDISLSGLAPGVHCCDLADRATGFRYLSSYFFLT